MLEYMDRASINAVEDGSTWASIAPRPPCSSAAADSPERTGRETRDHRRGVRRHNGATEVFATDDPAEGEAVHRGTARRHPGGGAARQAAAGGRRRAAAAPARAGRGHRGDRRRARGQIALIAHAGDGNTHPLIVFDPADADEAARAELAFGEIMDLAIALGGTITGEHGVGRLKKPWLRESGRRRTSWNSPGGSSGPRPAEHPEPRSDPDCGSESLSSTTHEGHPMTEYRADRPLQVARGLNDFVVEEALPATAVDAGRLLGGCGALVLA